VQPVEGFQNEAQKVGSGTHLVLELLEAVSVPI